MGGRIKVEAGGYGLHVPSLDADISVPRLLEDRGDLMVVTRTTWVLVDRAVLFGEKA